MPPKKKAKLPSRAPSMASQDNQSVAATPTRAETPVTGAIATPTFPADPWTDEQEISLLKGIVNWKPAGIHKHFRMIAIAQQLRHHGVAGPNDQHTRIPGIWRKLRNLYNLEAIDERENALDLEEDDEGEEEGFEAKKEPFYPFSLPVEEFGELMFDKRFAKDGSSSPTLSNRQLNTLRRGSDPSVTSNTRGSTAGIDDTEEDTDVKSTPQPRGRKPGARGGRTSKATPKSQVKPGPRKRGRKLAAKPAGEEEATGEEEADEEEEENENEGEEEEQDDSTVAGSPSSPPAKRGGAKAVRGVGRPRKGQGIADIRRSSRRK